MNNQETQCEGCGEPLKEPAVVVVPIDPDSRYAILIGGAMEDQYLAALSEQLAGWWKAEEQKFFVFAHGNLQVYFERMDTVPQEKGKVDGTSKE